MQKLIVLGTALALVLALELFAHTPPVWVDLPVPVPTVALDGTLDGLAASSTYWRYVFLHWPNLIEEWKTEGRGIYSVRFDGQDALLGLLDSEQQEKADFCRNLSLGTRMDRYSLGAEAETAFVDLNRADCTPCLTNPNGSDCETCLLPPDGYREYWGFLERGTLDARMYSINGGYPIDELENLVIRYRYAQADRANCAGWHSHRPGLGLHVDNEDHLGAGREGDWSRWYLMSALRSGTGTPPADPPADPVDPIAPTVDTSRWQARVDSLNALIVGQADQLKILSAENARLAATTTEGETVTVTIRDTVEVATVDTLLYCPKTNDELNDLFETFTGLADSTDAGTGKAVSSIQLRSWGAIKALVKGDN